MIFWVRAGGVRPGWIDLCEKLVEIGFGDVAVADFVEVVEKVTFGVDTIDPKGSWADG